MTLPEIRLSKLTLLEALSAFFAISFVLGIVASIYQVVSFADQGLTAIGVAELIFKLLFAMAGYLTYRLYEKQSVKVLSLTALLFLACLLYPFGTRHDLKIVISAAFSIALVTSLYAWKKGLLT